MTVFNTLGRAAGIALALAAAGPAFAVCPGAHLQPSVNFGRAFGTPEKATVAVDFGPARRYDDVLFQYFEYQSKEPGYARVFGVHVLRDSTTQQARVFLARLKDMKLVLVQAPLTATAVETILAIAAPIVRDTHYRQTPCEAMYLDGYVIQVGVDWQSGADHDYIAGEAFAPIRGTPAAQLQTLGRTLRAIAEGTMTESDLPLKPDRPAQ
jgi:hypothetical protein